MKLYVQQSADINFIVEILKLFSFPKKTPYGKYA